MKRYTIMRNIVRWVRSMWKVVPDRTSAKKLHCSHNAKVLPGLCLRLLAVLLKVHCDAFLSEKTPEETCHIQKYNYINIFLFIYPITAWSLWFNSDMVCSHARLLLLQARQVIKRVFLTPVARGDSTSSRNGPDSNGQNWTVYTE